jgi:hypothetical protein
MNWSDAGSVRTTVRFSLRCRWQEALTGAVFNPATMEAFSSHGNGTMTIVKENSRTSFVVEQNLQIMAGAKTLTLDSKTNHILTLAAEYGPAPARPPAQGAPPQGRGGRPAYGPVVGK